MHFRGQYGDYSTRHPAVDKSSINAEESEHGLLTPRYANVCYFLVFRACVKGSIQQHSLFGQFSLCIAAGIPVIKNNTVLRRQAKLLGDGRRQLDRTNGSSEACKNPQVESGVHAQLRMKFEIFALFLHDLSDSVLISM